MLVIRIVNKFQVANLLLFDSLGQTKVNFLTIFASLKEVEDNGGFY